MYEFIRGTLAASTPQCAVIEANGIGYRLLIPTDVDLPPIGQEVRLYTSLIVRETAHTLYGFTCVEERDTFERLTAISGIGPKTALSIIAHKLLVQQAIDHDSPLPLAKIPGIGKKTAERLLIELRGQVLSAGGIEADAISALIHLGYSQVQARQAIRKSLEKIGDQDLSRLISHALQL